MEKNSDDEDIIENSESKLEDHIEDDPIQEKILYRSQVLFSAMKEGREIPPQKDKEEAIKKMTTKLRKSSRTLERPMQTKEEVKPL